MIRVNLEVCCIVLELVLGEQRDFIQKNTWPFINITWNGLHLGSVCGHDLGSNWPLYLLMTVVSFICGLLMKINYSDVFHLTSETDQWQLMILATFVLTFLSQKFQLRLCLLCSNNNSTLGFLTH